MTQIASIRTLSLRSSVFLLLPLFLFCGSACPQESLPAARTISPGEMFTFFFLMPGLSKFWVLLCNWPARETRSLLAAWPFSLPR